MFLIKDKIGLASQVVKGRSGDKVIVMGSNRGGMLLVQCGKERFYVYPNEISENPINEKTEEISEIIHPIKKGRGCSKRNRS